MIESDTVRQLIDDGESFTVEFKGEEHQALPDGDLTLAAICLANGQGGWILVGVEDDGRVTGARPRHADRTDPARVTALIANRTQPTLVVDVDVVSIDGFDVIVVRVPDAPNVVGTIDGRYVQRATGIDGTTICGSSKVMTLLALDSGAHAIVMTSDSNHAPEPSRIWHRKRPSVRPEEAAA